MSPRPTVGPFEDPRRVLARHGLRPKRGFSQSFLVARGVVSRIADAVAPAEGELVVELGPGLGTLTAELLRRGARVLGIERDRDMLAVLAAELAGVGAFEAREGDAATIALDAIARDEGRPVKLVGNLPYAITGAILEHLVAHSHALERAVIMVQREVANRLLADPGTREHGALTVFVTARFEVEPICRVAAGAFHPVPRVASAVVALRPLPVPRAQETAAFRAVVRAVFESRRKTLRNSLLRIATAEAADRALGDAGLEPSCRGETLTVEQLGRLATALSGRWDR